MSDVFGESIAFEEDDTFTHGNGIGKPLGILNAPALVTVSRTSATDVKIADLVGMVARFRGNVGRAKFMVNQSTLPKLYQLADAAGGYVWIPNAGQSAPGSIYGIPYTITEKCSALGTEGDVILADWGFYLIGDRKGVTVEMSPHYKFQNDSLCFKATKRVDGQPWLDSAITPRRGGSTLSPFVALS